mgnify:CR=1 FL=1
MLVAYVTSLRMVFLSIWAGSHETRSLSCVESMACMKNSPSETTSLRARKRSRQDWSDASSAGRVVARVRRTCSGPGRSRWRPKRPF